MSLFDMLVKARVFPNRSKAINEKLQRLERNRLAIECAKLSPAEEKSLAEEGMDEELAQWPEY